MAKALYGAAPDGRVHITFPRLESQPGEFEALCSGLTGDRVVVSSPAKVKPREVCTDCENRYYPDLPE